MTGTRRARELVPRPVPDSFPQQTRPAISGPLRLQVPRGSHCHQGSEARAEGLRPRQHTGRAEALHDTRPELPPHRRPISWLWLQVRQGKQRPSSAPLGIFMLHANFGRGAENGLKMEKEQNTSGRTTQNTGRKESSRGGIGAADTHTHTHTAPACL